MVKLKYKFLISLIIICFSLLTVSASNINVMEEEGFFFQPEGKEYFVGKKKLDAQRLQEVTSGYYANSIQSSFSGNQATLSNLTIGSYGYEYREPLYQSLYYPIHLNDSKNIVSIQDFEGKEMNYSFFVNEGTTQVKLYFDSFMNKIQRNNGEINDFEWAYEKQYSQDPKKLKILFDDNSFVEFDFKFFIPEFSFENEVHQNELGNIQTIVPINGNKIVIHYEENPNFENMLWRELPWDSQINEEKTEIVSEYFIVNEIYKTFFGEYDFFVLQYKVVDENYLCSISEQENMQLLVTEGDLELNIGKDGNQISDISVELKKFDFSNKSYTPVGTFPVTFVQGSSNHTKKVLFPMEIDNGLYRMDVKSYSTLRMDLCNNNNATEVRDELFNGENLIEKNFEFIVKDNSMYNTVQLKDIFYNFYEGFNSFDFEKFQFLDVFQYDVKTLSGETLVSVDKECHLNSECRAEKNQLLFSYFNQKGNFSELTYEVNYKFFFETNVSNSVFKFDSQKLADIFGFDVNFIHVTKGNNYSSEPYDDKNYRIYNFYDYRDGIKLFTEIDNQLTQFYLKPEIMTENFYYEIDCSEYSKYCDLQVFVKDDYSSQNIKIKIEYDNGKIIETTFQDDVPKYFLPEGQEDKKQKASQNNIFSTEHFFVKSFSGVLFARNIQTEYISNDDQSENVTFTFGATITGENVSVNYDKLFVCETPKGDFSEIIYGNDCYTVNELESRKILFEREVYLYGLDGLITGEGKNFETTIQIQSIPKYFPQGLG